MVYELLQNKTINTAKYSFQLDELKVAIAIFNLIENEDRKRA